jgi:hypothetical protein
MSALLSFKLVFDGHCTTAVSIQDPFFPVLTWSILVSRMEDNSFCSVLLSASTSHLYSIRGLVNLHLYGGLSPAQIKKEESLIMDCGGEKEAVEGKWEALFYPIQANTDQSLFVEIDHLKTPSFICYLRSE